MVTGQNCTKLPLQKRSEIDFKLPWKCSNTALILLQDCLEDALKLLIALILPLKCSGLTSNLPQKHSKTDLESL